MFYLMPLRFMLFFSSCRRRVIGSSNGSFKSQEGLTLGERHFSRSADEQRKSGQTL